MLSVIKSWWDKFAPRTKIAIVAVAVAVLGLLYLLASLHSYKKLAASLQLQIKELQAKYKIEVLNGDIRAAQGRVDVRQGDIDELSKKIEAQRTQLQQQYQSNGMSADEIANSFTRLGL